VGCGATFSLAREVSPVEGVALRRGLRQTEQALESLLTVYGEAEILHRAMSDVKQERFSAAVLSMGVVTSWGMGNHGELGLGKYMTFSPSPLAIPRFRNMRIVQIAAGPEHVLAINSKKQLFSWGRGQSGRLGLSDFEDRYAPEYVSFYKSYNVEYCAAGYAHSAVLITNISVRGVTTTAQLRRLSTFGRGYHGRLGNGTNRNSCIPVAVTEWPPSTKGLQIRQVACGGAHTLVLLEKIIPVGLASPW
jgi:alpha-tubulin suppressor-like RCC1 family protein